MVRRTDAGIAERESTLLASTPRLHPEANSAMFALGNDLGRRLSTHLRTAFISWVFLWGKELWHPLMKAARYYESPCMQNSSQPSREGVRPAE